MTKTCCAAPRQDADTSGRRAAGAPGIAGPGIPEMEVQEQLPESHGGSHGGSQQTAAAAAHGVPLEVCTSTTAETSMYGLLNQFHWSPSRYAYASVLA